MQASYQKTAKATPALIFARFEMMEEKDFIYLPISSEYMMSFLFGKWNYHGHVGGI